MTACAPLPCPARWPVISGYVAAAVMVAMSLLCASPTLANTAADETSQSNISTGNVIIDIKSVEVGFDRLYKVGCWTPVRITLSNPDPESFTATLVATVNDCDGVAVNYTLPDKIELASGDTQTYTLYVRFGHLTSPLTLDFSRDGQPLLQRVYDSTVGEDHARYLPPALPSSENLLVNIGELGIDRFLRQIRNPARAAMVDDASALPDKWYGYEGIDLVVLSATDLQQFASLSEAPRLAALQRWISLGGRLVLFAGRDAVDDMVAAEHPLLQFLPGEPTGTQTLRRTTALEAFTGVSAPLLSPTAARALQVPRIEVGEGLVLVRQDTTPLVIRTTAGLGEETFVALPFHQDPFLDWPARGAFLERVLQVTAAADEEDSTRLGRQVSHTGITDLSGQLRGALDQFAGVSLAPFLLVSLLSLGYILLIGPVDYFFLKKAIRRMEWTWVTFPLIVIGFSAAAYFMANSMKGDSVRVNQADVVDVDVNAGLVRGTTWFNVFSPSTSQYNVAVAGRLPNNELAAADQSLVSWMGLPGPALGGMETAGLNSALVQGAYSSSPALDSLSGVPVPVWSSKSFTARWTAEMNSSSAPEVVLSAGPDGVPQGRIRNTLDVPLKNCLLLYGRWAFSFDELESRGVRLIDRRTTSRREIQNQLTGRIIEYSNTSKQYETVSSAYDVLSFDIPIILQQMMFYRVTGGENYTRVLNQYQSFIDFSDQLAADQAILMGFVDRPGSEIRLADGAAGELEHFQSWTCYRFVYPVKQLEPGES